MALVWLVEWVPLFAVGRVPLPEACTTAAVPLLGRHLGPRGAQVCAAMKQQLMARRGLDAAPGCCCIGDALLALWCWCALHHRCCALL